MPHQLFSMFFFSVRLENRATANHLNGSLQLMESQSWLYAPGNVWKYFMPDNWSVYWSTVRTGQWSGQCKGPLEAWCQLSVLIDMVFSLIYIYIYWILSMLFLHFFFQLWISSTRLTCCMARSQTFAQRKAVQSCQLVLSKCNTVGLQ